MSEQIDWSKAPKWATRLMRNKYWCPNAWADDHKDAIWVTDYEPGSNIIFNLDPAAWDLIENRPTTPSWSGEGLPPVGVVCEVKLQEEWSLCEIIAHFQQPQAMVAAFTVAQFHGGKKLDSKIAECFRPIRTPEQIAADERDAAILDMERICRSGDFGSGGLAALYDAGYRKEQK